MITALKVLFAVLLLTQVLSTGVQASEKEQYLNIVNPVRISSYNLTPGESLKNEYEIINEHNLPATWLFTYDALVNPEVISVAGEMNEEQEFGIFLEITPDLAEASGVEYHDTGRWHHAYSVFLSGYTQEESVKIIDRV